MSDEQSKPADTPADWIGFDEAYEAFRQANPMLGLASGMWATTNLRRNYGAQLLELGVVRQLVSRRWLAHREHFGPALFKLLTRTPAAILAEADARRRAQRSA